MIDLSRVRGASQLMVIWLLGATGCQATNLIGEVDGAAGSPGTVTVDAVAGESIIISADAGVDRGGTPDAVGGDPGQSYDAYPADRVGQIVSDSGPGTAADGSGNGDSVRADGSLPPPADGSIASDAFGGGCPVSYPATGFFGENVAYPRTTSLRADVRGGYTFAADVPLGFSLTFTITRVADSGPADAGFPGSIWSFSDSDFRATTYDQTTNDQMFMSRLVGRNEMNFSFGGAGQARIDYYECGSATPTRVQIIDWAP